MGAEILIILLLLVGNGVFAMTEIAVVSARKTRLRRMADQGDRRAAVALELAESPNRFLSTVQVGITLVGVLAGAFGGATIAEKIATSLREFPAVAPYAESIGVAVVVLAITYFSLIIGELVPKRLALANPEGIARIMAGPMNRLSRLAGPAVSFLGFSTDFVLRLIGAQKRIEEAVTDDEVKALMLEGFKAGVFHSAEPKMVESVLALDRLPVSEIMTPRPKMIFLNKTDTHEAVWHKIVVSGHSNFPVYEGDRDNVIGVASVKSIYANLAAGARADVADLVTQPLVVPTTQFITQLLDSFKTSGKHVALVADEFGSIVGLVTLVDVLEAIVGEIATPSERLQPVARRRDDGSWLVDATLEVEALARQIPGLSFPPGRSREYETAAGFLLERFGRVPQEGDMVDWCGHRFEVIDMDRHRIDKILVTVIPAPPATPETASGA